MGNKIFFGALRSILCLLCVCVFGSCGPDLRERDFFLSQSRDPKLIGKWLFVSESMDKPPLIIEYTAGGEIKETSDGRDVSGRDYYYTKDGVLYKLSIGDGFKVSNRTWKYEYHFSDDGNILYTRHHGSDMEYSHVKRLDTSHDK